MTYDNRLREMLEAGDVPFGAVATTLSPVMIDVFAGIGLDYVWLDHEHIGPSSSDALVYDEITRTADAAGIEPIVRIQSGDPAVIRKALDAGIRNLVVPRVETADEVRRAVEASRFSYDGGVGDRGVGTSLANNWGDRSDDYTGHEDATAMVAVMLENAAALDNIDDILSVPELGLVWIGPADLSVSLGHPLEFEHPAVQDAIATFLDASDDAGVPIGTNANFTGGVEAALESGYDMVHLNSDVGAVREILGDQLTAARRAVE